jgi:hypothetical protein
VKAELPQDLAQAIECAGKTFTKSGFKGDQPEYYEHTQGCLFRLKSIKLSVDYQMSYHDCYDGVYMGKGGFRIMAQVDSEPPVLMVERSLDSEDEMVEQRAGKECPMAVFTSVLSALDLSQTCTPTQLVAALIISALGEDDCHRVFKGHQLCDATAYSCLEQKLNPVWCEVLATWSYRDEDY